jgi:hypothetical protein
MSIDDLFKVSVRAGTVAVSAPGFETVGLFVGTKIPLETPEMVSIARPSEIQFLDPAVYPVKAIQALANVYFGQEVSPRVLKIYGMGDTVHYNSVQIHFNSEQSLLRLGRFQCNINTSIIDVPLTGTTAQRLTAITSAIAAAQPFDGTTTVTSVSDDGYYIRFAFTAQKPGALVVEAVGKTRASTFINITDSTVGAGFAELLAATLAVDNDVFWCVNGVVGTAANAAFAAELSAVRKIHSALIVTSRGDTGVGTMSWQDGLDHAATLKAATRINTVLTHSYGLDGKALALAATMAPWAPGRLTAMYKRFRGCVPDGYTSQQISAMESNRLNAYISKTKDIGIYQEGFTSGPEYVDTQSGIWWLIENIQTDLLSLFVSSLKVEFNSYGLGRIKEAITNVFKRGGSNRLVQSFEVIAPSLEDIPASDKSGRKVRQVPFKARFLVVGAIHFVDVDVTMEL